MWLSFLDPDFDERDPEMDCKLCKQAAYWERLNRQFYCDTCDFAFSIPEPFFDGNEQELGEAHGY
jgi:hypothetical protein